ncbi:MAG: DNA polymerase III subunit alpha, partial [Firmicutes bacterium]|nr:DNA polymerase III subunit alpha [Bacillota bacterium]
AVQQLAGYSLAEADIFRRAISKKNAALLASTQADLQARLVKRGMTMPAAEDFGHQIAAFAQYGFNKSHAAAYALLSYASAYLKAHYPLAFWAQELTSLIGSDRLPSALQGVVAAGMRLYAPSVNDSAVGFSYVPEAGLRVGLSLVRGLPDAIAKHIVHEREQGGQYVSYQDFMQRTRKIVDDRSYQALQRAGCLRTLPGSQASSGQLTWFEAVDASTKPSVSIDSQDALGWQWPQAHGPIYVRLRAAQDFPALGDELHRLPESCGGGVPVIAVLDKERGRQFNEAGLSDRFSCVEKLRRLDIVSGVGRRVVWQKYIPDTEEKEGGEIT